jgi:multisubunit Na+/H+ antiporter MnhB subunit
LALFGKVVRVRLMLLPWMRMEISFLTGGGGETNMVNQFLVPACCVDVIGELLI